MSSISEIVAAIAAGLDPMRATKEAVDAWIFAGRALAAAESAMDEAEEQFWGPTRTVADGWAFAHALHNFAHAARAYDSALDVLLSAREAGPSLVRQALEALS